MGKFDTLFSTSTPTTTKPRSTSTGKFDSLFADVKSPETVPIVEPTQTQQPEKKQGFFGKINSAVQSFSNKVFGAVGGNAIVHPIDTFNSIKNSVKTDIDTSINNLVSSSAQFRSNVIDNTNRTGAEKVSATLNLLHSIASISLLPASESFSIASKLPVIKPASDAIGVVFDKSGKVASFSADKLLNAIPDSVLSKQSKQTLSEPIKSVSSLAGQIVLGGYIYEKITGLTDAKPKEIEKAKIDIEKKAEEINKTAETQSATVEPAVLAKNATPVDSVQPGTGKFSNLFADKGVKQEKVSTPATIDSVGATPAELPQTTIPALAKKTVDRAFEEGIKADFGDLPEVRTMNMAEQRTKAESLISKDREFAKKVAMGDEVPPGDLRAESVYKALEMKARSEGDVQTIYDLAHSRTARETVALGQRIKALDTEITESPVKAIKDIETVREERAKSRSKDGIERDRRTTVDDIKREIKKNAPTRQTWEEFINSIKC